MLTKVEKIAKIKEWLGKTQLDALIVKRNLNVEDSHISPAVLIASSEKLIKVNKGTVEADDRDNLRYSKFMGLEDFIDENITRDAGRVQQKAGQKMQQKRNLSWLSPGFFTSQVRSVIIGNALSQNVDGINPIEHWDNSHRVTKLGPGGIPTIDAVPAESRQVNTSSFGFFDPVHIMESERVGITNYISHNVVKGRDGKLYRVMKDKHGKLHWYNHEDILDHQVKIPEN